MIHESAIIGPDVQLGADVAVGPYCVISGRVKLGDGVKLHSHVVMDGDTTVGAGTEIFPFASVGLPPQDKKFEGENSRLEIGKNCVIREQATLQPGTSGGGLVTRVGDNCLIMVGAHVAHDCQIGNNVILVNYVGLAGHVEVDDFAILGGSAGVHQFVRIGKHAMIGGLTGVVKDVLPYSTVTGDRAHLEGLNLVGLKRRGFNRDEIKSLRLALASLTEDATGTLSERLDEIRETSGDVASVSEMLAFIETSQRGLTL